MKVLIAPNALKGSLSAALAAEAMASALPNEWKAIICPIADGGDGTLDCLVQATKGKYFETVVDGPLPVQKVNARWGVLGDGKTAVVEMAEASGLRLLKPHEYAITHTTTFGVGELIRAALDTGFRKLLIGLGGSATNDGGAGCAQALGFRFLDSDGEDLAPGGIHLRHLRHIDSMNADKRLKDSEFIGLADVNNVLFGPSGASRVFAPQKGATEVQVEQLEESIRNYSDVLAREFKVDVARMPCSGAAGGLGAGLVAFCGARLLSGIDYILDAVGFDDLVRKCDLVLTAEGSVDGQTVRGKGIAGIALRARKFNKRVHVFAGRVDGEPEILCGQLGVSSVQEITPKGLDTSEALRRAPEFLSAAVMRFIETAR